MFLVINCFRLRPESFERAEVYRSKLRPILPPVYNDSRLRESPVPRLSFASESNDDNVVSLADLFSNDNDNSTRSVDGSFGIDTFEFVSTQNSLDVQKEDPTNGSETDEKNPLENIELDAEQCAAFHDIFGDNSRPMLEDAINNEESSFKSNEDSTGRHNDEINRIGMNI